ncbi:MAG: biotin carboxyl carrier domain-containing protein [Deltaproteobacteria bacterium]|nr:MAG: biotin carboxyl carrier domain-containing protein [Deltaproteobacteria bacterium]
MDDVGAVGGGGVAIAEESELGPGEELLRSPIEGQFYRRPAPEEPPYLEEGAAIAAGSVLGLVEVMKFFHPVRFERVGQWSLVRFLVDEGAAVDSGAPLAVIRKLSSGAGD